MTQIQREKKEERERPLLMLISSRYVMPANIRRTKYTRFLRKQTEPSQERAGTLKISRQSFVHESFLEIKRDYSLVRNDTIRRMHFCGRCSID